MPADSEPSFQRAKSNPWYLLAIFNGENDKKEVTERNRCTWNRWVSSYLTEEQRASLTARGFSENEIHPFSPDEKIEILEQISRRSNCSLEKINEILCDNFIFFNNIYFESNAIFSNFIFPQLTSFQSAKFTKFADFSGAIFFGSIDFRSATFLNPVEFIGTTAYHHADFIMARFESRAIFRKFRVEGYATEFNETVFLGFADFREAIFSAPIYFTNAKFEREAFFMQADFLDRVIFEGATFAASTSFSASSFAAYPPDFRDAKLREATEWHGSKWPTSPADQDQAQYFVYAYERLKSEMERLKKHEDEQYFFGKELHARRLKLWFDIISSDKKLDSCLPNIICFLSNWAYEFFGGYGLSITKPISWLIFTFALGTAVFAMTTSTGSGPMEWLDAAGLSATNLVSFLPYKPFVEHLSVSAKIVGNSQSVLGLIFLFLLGLGLRNRFRMR